MSAEDIQNQLESQLPHCNIFMVRICCLDRGKKGWPSGLIMHFFKENYLMAHAHDFTAAAGKDPKKPDSPKPVEPKPEKPVQPIKCPRPVPPKPRDACPACGMG